MTTRKLTAAQMYALAYYAAAEDGTRAPAKRWDAKQSPRWDVVDKLRGWGLLQREILWLTPAGREALRTGVRPEAPAPAEPPQAPAPPPAPEPSKPEQSPEALAFLGDVECSCINCSTKAYIPKIELIMRGRWTCYACGRGNRATPIEAAGAPVAPV